MIDSPGPVRREPEPVPPAVVAVIRGAALVVVLPVRLLWEFLVACARWTERWLIGPIGRFLTRWLLRPLAWLLRQAIWAPLTWLGRAVAWLARWLGWIPLQWLGRAVAWFARTVLRPPVVWLLLAVAWVAHHLLVRPVVWLGRLLAPIGLRCLAGLVALGRWVGHGVAAVARVLSAALRWAWWAAGRLLWWCYLVTLRPVVRGVAWVWRHAVVPVGRALAAAWRATVGPVLRAVRRTVVDPVRVTVGEVLAAFGLRR